ncbi:PREDICTED: uncharacterized protein LOC101296232 [Fragaria vesca subsp. vesca]|uniref:uncharacterized protein LOC101296232 n=1 Tax=Fragaria vesca subsp. vesca TaxID=101020 RepID=UPI0002C348DB|nr:PREDICTED: uncharacterized protein LOC101296232 [Fragaria vesca subsp. vesca]
MAQRGELASEEVELSISQILGKIDRFIEMIAELLDSGKVTFKKIGDEYEMIHVHLLVDDSVLEGLMITAKQDGSWQFKGDLFGESYCRPQALQGRPLWRSILK